MLDFPNTPTTGQIFVAPNGVTYQWDGTLWKSVSMTGGGTVDFFAAMTGSGIPNTLTTITVSPVVSGNSGGWYSGGRFTPPAGRYHIFAKIGGGMTTGGTTMTAAIRKNGTLVAVSNQAITNANNEGAAIAAGNFDASGSDWFDFQAMSSAGTANITAWIWLGAFSIPDGRPSPGFVGVPWRQIGRVVPTAGQATVDFQNVPSDINDLELRFEVLPTTNNVNLYFQFYDNAGALDGTSGHYVYSKVYTHNGVASGTAAASYGSTGENITSAIVLNAVVPAGLYNGVGGGMSGRLTTNNIRDAAHYKSVEWHSSYLDQTASFHVHISGTGARQVTGAITGFQMRCSTGTFAAGGAVSLYGSP